MYYPKSQIQTNLYTNGKELYYDLSKEEYIGYYWKTSKDEFFSGKTPQDTPTFKLSGYNLSPNVSLYNNNKYTTTVGDTERVDSYVDNNFNIDLNIVIGYPLYKGEKKLLPSYSPTTPTFQDYQIGEYRRYFCKKTNENIYLEINKDTYDKLVSKNPTMAFQYYQPFNIPWKLTGDKVQVYTVNKNIVELTMKRQKLSMFDKYLQEDYTKYYI